MNVWIFLGILVVLAFLQSCYRSWRHPDEEVPFESIPIPLYRFLGQVMPDIVDPKVRIRYWAENAPWKYFVTGTLAGKRVEVEMELSMHTEPVIKEYEIDFDLDAKPRRFGREVPESEWDREMIHRAHELFARIEIPYQNVDRVRKGKIAGQPAFRLDGQLVRGEFEFMMLATGEPIELELELR